MFQPDPIRDRLHSLHNRHNHLRPAVSVHRHVSDEFPDHILLYAATGTVSLLYTTLTMTRFQSLCVFVTLIRPKANVNRGVLRKFYKK